jgi:hypothetical protein
MVSDLINSATCSWEIQILRNNFVPIDLVILAIPLSIAHHSDFWASHHEKSGVFSVRLAYPMMIVTKNEGGLPRRRTELKLCGTSRSVLGQL